MAETNLRQSKSKAKLVGVISQMTLTKGEHEGQDQITGTVVVECSPTNFVTVNCSSKKLTKAGGENKGYKALETIMSEYKSISVDGREEATRVRFNGEMEPNTYYSKRGDLVQGVRVRAGYFNTLTGLDLEGMEQEASFTVEGCIRAMNKEFDKQGMPTGRGLVTIAVPLYSRTDEMVLIIPEEYADTVAMTYQIGQTVMFDGEIINSRVETVREVPMAIGKPKIEKSVSYTNEYIISGASTAYLPDNGDKSAYDVDTIEKALHERDLELEKRKNESTNSTVQKASTTTNRPLPTAAW